MEAILKRVKGQIRACAIRIGGSPRPSNHTSKGVARKFLRMRSRKVDASFPTPMGVVCVLVRMRSRWNVGGGGFEGSFSLPVITCSLSSGGAITLYQPVRFSSASTSTPFLGGIMENSDEGVSAFEMIPLCVFAVVCLYLFS